MRSETPAGVVQLAKEMWPYGDSNPHPLGERYSVGQAIRLVIELDQIDEEADCDTQD